MGQVGNLRADCQSALRRQPTAAQDFILPHIGRQRRGRSQPAFAFVLIEGFDTPAGDVSKPPVQRSQSRLIERRAAGVSRVAEVFKPHSGHFRGSMSAPSRANLNNKFAASLATP